MEFEDSDYDLSYCEGDTPLDEVDWDKLTKIKDISDAINTHPSMAHRNFASLLFLSELYGKDLDVR